MTQARQSFGRWGEALAASYLSQLGYEILERNVRTPYGEIDLVARLEDVIAFVEVKSRRSLAFGWPEQAVSARKQARLLDACRAYLQAHPEIDGTPRIDVIAILQLDGGAPPEIAHYENAVHP